MKGAEDVFPAGRAAPFQGLPDFPALRFLQDRPQWVAWEYCGSRKVPIDAKNGCNASVSDPNTWGDYDAAASRAVSTSLAGVGFVLTADGGFVGIDLDGCRDAETGALEPWAADVVGLKETYTEISPSGRGLRMLALAESGVAGLVAPYAGVEIYASGGRYLTITGDHLPETPVVIAAAPHTLAMLQQRVAAVAKPIREGDIAPPNEKWTGKDTPFSRVNSAALQNLSAWVPTLFPAAREQGKGYRVSSYDLDRPLEEDLSITPRGIKDFGVYDMGDARGGRRTPIDLVLEHGVAAEIDVRGGPTGAARWICEHLDIDPGSLGLFSPSSAFDDVAAVSSSHTAENGSKAPDQNCAATPLQTLNGHDFAARELRPRPWLVRDMIPDRTVTLLSGDGGTGKSLLAQQLAVAVAGERDWLGITPAWGGVVYLSAEDDVDEVHRRLVDITAAYGLQLEDLANLHVVPMAGRDAVLAAPDRSSELIKETRLWFALVATVKSIRPWLLVLDNLADVFAGNENVRPLARQFIGMLRGVAIECELAVLVISHPSLTGMASGAGTSGSTAWSNSVRSRMYLERAKAEDGDEPDPNLRVLRVMKANYAAVGAEIRMRWKDGTLRLESGGPGQVDRVAAEAKAERVFLALLNRFVSDGRNVSYKRSPSFAPTLFAKQPDAEGCTKVILDRAMERLLASGKIRIKSHGPPSRNYSRIVPAE